MPKFYYQGRDRQGKLVTGAIDAPTPEAVAIQLEKDNVIPVTIDRGRQTNVLKVATKQVSVDKKVSTKVLVLFCRQMYSLIKAGVPVASAILHLASTTRQPAFAGTLKEVARELAAGQNLAKAMQLYPKAFPKLVVNLIRLGIEGASLDATFLQVSNYLELQYRTGKQIKAVLRYPSFVLTAIIGAIVVINYFVIPPFSKMYKSFDAQLPVPTKILLNFSNFMNTYWLWLLSGFLLIAGTVYYLLKKDYFRELWDKYKLHLPIFGAILHQVLLARFTKTFAIVIRSGMPLTEAVGLVADVMGNAFMKKQFYGMRQSLERGANLTTSATASEVFTPLVLQMIAIGEETGELEGMLEKVSELYEDELATEIAQLSDRISVIILMAVAGMVLILALGVFLPMWNLSQIAH